MRKTLTNGGGKPCIRAMFYNGSRLCEAVDFVKQMFNLKQK